MELMKNNTDVPNIQISIEEIEKEPVVHKKRGRKPKGGKIVIKNVEITNSSPVLPNIILHLKCSLQDLNEHNNKIQEMVTDPLKYKPIAPPEIMAYNNTKESFFSYELKNKTNTQIAYKPIEKEGIMICKCCSENDTTDKEENHSMKDITNKLKELRIQFYKNTINDKKSACFWCTFDFDNPPCYIPKYEVKNEIGGYGSFCRPECAVGYLMKENIDDSTKFERYHLLNRIYSKESGYTKNIKPAPNPYFLLDKYFGNLSIQEYRKLSSSSYMLLVIENI